MFVWELDDVIFLIVIGLFVLIVLLMFMITWFKNKVGNIRKFFKKENDNE